MIIIIIMINSNAYSNNKGEAGRGLALGPGQAGQQNQVRHNTQSNETGEEPTDSLGHPRLDLGARVRPRPDDSRNYYYVVLVVLIVLALLLLLLYCYYYYYAYDYDCPRGLLLRLLQARLREAADR